MEYCVGSRIVVNQSCVLHMRTSLDIKAKDKYRDINIFKLAMGTCPYQQLHTVYIQHSFRS